MRRPATLISASLLALMAGCATDLSPDSTSHIAGAQFRDVSALTVFIADILANSMVPVKTTLRLVPFTGPDTAHAQILLTNTLRERGFALSPDGMDYPGASEVRYSVSPVGLNLLLELDVNDASATCLYSHDPDGSLRRTGSCSLRAGSALTLRIPKQEVLAPGAMPAEAPKPLQTEPAGPVPLHPALPAASAPVQIASNVPIQAEPLPPQPIRSFPVPVETWTLVEGTPIREQMISWADRAGWKVQWPQELNWNVPAITSFTGDFHTVMSNVIHTIADEGKSIRAEFHTSNHYLVVTSPGGDGR